MAPQSRLQQDLASTVVGVCLTPYATVHWQLHSLSHMTACNSIPVYMCVKRVGAQGHQTYHAALLSCCGNSLCSYPAVPVQ